MGNLKACPDERVEEYATRINRNSLWRHSVTCILIGHFPILELVANGQILFYSFK